MKKAVMNRGTRFPATYEEAMEEYNSFLYDDKITGGYARLFGDYMGIALGILPVFLVVTRELRDRRAGMEELIYTRTASSGKNRSKPLAFHEFYDDPACIAGLLLHIVPMCRIMPEDWRFL